MTNKSLSVKQRILYSVIFFLGAMLVGTFVFWPLADRPSYNAWAEENHLPAWPQSQPTELPTAVFDIVSPSAQPSPAVTSTPTCSFQYKLLLHDHIITSGILTCGGGSVRFDSSSFDKMPTLMLEAHGPLHLDVNGFTKELEPELAWYECSPGQRFTQASDQCLTLATGDQVNLTVVMVMVIQAFQP